MKTGFFILALSAALPAAAGSLSDKTAPENTLQSTASPGTLRAAPSVAAPLQSVAAPGSLSDATPQGQLQNTTSNSTLREAEIPPARLEQTRSLLGELNAQQRDSSIIIALPGDILFDFDKSDLRPDALPTIAKVRELLAGYPQAPVVVHGHTDSKGDDAYNLALSERRAQTVATALQESHGQAVRIKAYGESLPVAANEHPDGRDNPEGRQLNRRVEIEIAPSAQ